MAEGDYYVSWNGQTGDDAVYKPECQKTDCWQMLDTITGEDRFRRFLFDIQERLIDPKERASNVERWIYDIHIRRKPWIILGSEYASADCPNV